MDKKELESKLLGYLDNDCEKLDKYSGILSTCHKPYDVANRVIKPMFMEGDIDKDDIGKEDYYGTLADLVEVQNNRHIPHKSLYYHINIRLQDWKKEKEQNLNEASFRHETRIKRNTDGSLEIFNYIYVQTVPDNVSDLLAPYIGQGYAEMKKKLQKHFNARGEAEVMEIKCASWLMTDVIMALKETVGDMTVSFKSRYTRQNQIPLSAVLEIVESETDEEQESF